MSIIQRGNCDVKGQIEWTKFTRYQSLNWSYIAWFGMASQTEHHPHCANWTSLWTLKSANKRYLELRESDLSTFFSRLLFYPESSIDWLIDWLIRWVQWTPASNHSPALKRSISVLGHIWITSHVFYHVILPSSLYREQNVFFDPASKTPSGCQ